MLNNLYVSPYPWGVTICVTPKLLISFLQTSPALRQIVWLLSCNSATMRRSGWVITSLDHLTRVGGGACKCCGAWGAKHASTVVLRGGVETAIAGPDSGFACARLAMGGGIIVYVIVLLPIVSRSQTLAGRGSLVNHPNWGGR